LRKIKHGRTMGGEEARYGLHKKKERKIEEKGTSTFIKGTTYDEREKGIMDVKATNGWEKRVSTGNLQYPMI